jgi:transcriptional regulator with XRE-family HTH domain
MTTVLKTTARVDLENTSDQQQVPGLPERLKTAREASRYSRAQVAQQTSIPPKSIEKFESGDQEPSVSRLLSLATLYGTTVEYLLGTANASASSLSTIQPTQPPSQTENSDDPVRILLDELDEYRLAEFKDATRRGVVAVAELRTALGSLEPEDLITLARERELYSPTTPALQQLRNLFVSHFENAQTACNKLEERIIDTSVIGIDLHSVSLESLASLAERLEVKNPDWGRWKKHDVIVPLLRPQLYTLAFTGHGEEFDSVEKYPYREEIDAEE